MNKIISFFKALALIAHEALFAHMTRSGMVLNAVSLPNGVVFSLATAYGSPINVTAVSNANPPVCTAAAHGLNDGDIIEFTSGWQKLNGRLFRVTEKDTGTFKLEGVNASSTADFPAGSGTGTVRKVTTFTQISQVTDLSTSGGEQQFATYSFLENDFESQIPTNSSAQSVSMVIADDPSLAGYIALKAAAETRDVRGLKAQYPNGSVAYYNGYVSLNETPTLTKGSINTVTATFSLLAKLTRYAS